MGREAVSGEWDDSWDNAPPWYPTALDVHQLDAPDLELLACLGAVLQQLPGRCGDVLSRRLGLESGSAQTLQEIAEDYGRSRERIRQLEAGAVRRIGTRLAPHRRGNLSPAERFVVDRLAQAFRSPHEPDRGRYLHATFPDANGRVLGRLLGQFTSASERDIGSWLAAFDEVRRQEEKKASARRRADHRWDRFIGGAVWPVEGRAARWPLLSPCRDVRVDGGEVWSPKLQRRVQYDSGLEECLIRLFDESEAVAGYCEQPLRLQFQWSGETRRYVPDFAIRLRDGRAVLVEAKPPTLWVDAMNLAKWDCATRWCGRMGWGFVVSDGRRHPEDLVRAADERDLAVLDRLTAAGPVPWRRVRPPWFASGRSWPQLVAAALAYGFTIRRGDQATLERAGDSPWLDSLHRKVLASPKPDG